METYEHKEAGDKIAIETRNNPYLPGTGKHSKEQQKKLKYANEFKVQMMQDLDGVPVPLDLTLSPGDIVALAGDYYTKAGWGLELTTPKPGNPDHANKELLATPVKESETRAFKEAYADLANPSVKKSDIERIYYIEDKLPNLLQQIAYACTVKDYGKKLINNEAHFDPWSVRAYMIGHASALHSAELARASLILAGENVTGKIAISKDLRSEPDNAVTSIKKDPQKYGFSGKETDNQIFKELAQRYHAKAVAEELFIMHFYSDHFAGGHLSRIGTLRKSIPEQFGTWGSILINTMHNEDNTRSVKAVNQNQATKPGHSFQMIRERFKAFGDDTYNQPKNNRNANMLVNGMTNSVGDIYRLIETGEKPSPENYGGMSFLASVDYSKRQTQPLLLQGSDGTAWFRSDVRNVKILSPSKYQETLKNPGANGYEKLTTFNAFLLVLKLRLLGFLYEPKVEQLSEKQKADILQDEKEYGQKSRQNEQPEVFNQPEVKREVKSGLSEKPKSSQIKSSVQPGFALEEVEKALTGLNLSTVHQEESLEDDVQQNQALMVF